VPRTKTRLKKKKKERKSSVRQAEEQGMVVQAYNLSTQEAETRR
jgi:hypothetical protein